MELIVEEGKGGPRFPDPIRAAERVGKLRRDITDRLAYVFDAIAETKRRLAGRVPVIGFAGAPLTLAAYMIEGQGSKTFDTFKTFLYAQPKAAHDLFEALAHELTRYLLGQIAAGANMLQLFDTWAGLLPEREYREFGLRHASTVLRSVRDAAPDIPFIYFPKGVRSYEGFAETGATGFGIDWQTSLARAVAELPEQFSLQGNLDPALLMTSPDLIRERTLAMMAAVPTDRSYVVNLGHGILPTTPVDNARAFIDAAKSVTLT